MSAPHPNATGRRDGVTADDLAHARHLADSASTPGQRTAAQNFLDTYATPDGDEFEQWAQEVTYAATVIAKSTDPGRRQAALSFLTRKEP